MTKPAAIHHAKIESGKVVWMFPRRVKEAVQTLEGCRVEITIRKHRDKRSDGQNRWYWGVIIPLLGEHLGYQAEEMHQALKNKFLAIGVDGPLPSARSTAGLNTAEFSDYCARCQQLGAEMGVWIPGPGEVDVDQR